MIDNLSILLSHALIAIAFYLLMNRDDLDTEDPPKPDEESIGFHKQSMASLKKRTAQRQMGAKADTLKKENESA